MQDKTYMRGLLREKGTWTMVRFPTNFHPPRGTPTRPLSSYVFSDAYVLQVCGLRTQNGIALQSLFISIDSFGARRVLQPLSSLLFVFSSSYLYLPLGLVHGRCRVQDILSFACVPAVTVSLCLLPLVVSSSYLWSKYVTL
jgi:hypothetical protein